MIKKTVAEFMQDALYNPKDGYYVSQNPIGKNNDFITAPEISQLFGEMIGIFCAKEWLRLNKPKEFYLVELGPGRGTMMQDLLRATKHISGFLEAADIHLVETNKNHILLQQKLFKGTWHQDMYSLPQDKPIILVANEFFDCLPINQYIFSDNIWCQRYIEEDIFVNLPVDEQTSLFLKEQYPNAKEGSIVEINYPAREITKYLCDTIKKTTGSILAIDYGYNQANAFGSSLQAIKNHKFSSIFADVGSSDLTAHVDFKALRDIALEKNLNAYITSQREFLLSLGIDLRAKILIQKANLNQQEEIKAGLSRLIDHQQMGELFKVINLYS